MAIATKYVMSRLPGSCFLRVIGPTVSQTAKDTTSLIMKRNLLNPLDLLTFPATLISAMDICTRTQAIYSHLEMYLTGKSLIKPTRPGRRDTSSMHQTSKLYGINGFDHTDPFSAM